MILVFVSFDPNTCPTPVTPRVIDSI